MFPLKPTVGPLSASSAAGSWWAKWRSAWRLALRELRAGQVALTRFLDTRAFPAIVAYATSRPHIVGLLLLGVVLMLWHDALVELVGGNYTNIISALVSCIVLLQTVAHRHETRQMRQQHGAQIQALHAQHQQDMSALHAKLDATLARTAPSAASARTAPSAPVSPRKRQPPPR